MFHLISQWLITTSPLEKFLGVILWLSGGVAEGVLELIQSMPAQSGACPIVPMSPLCCL